MARLRRFEDHRYVGARDTMRLYDTDDATQSELLAERIESDALLENKLLQTFGPDTVEEAANRGFKPVRG
jgi:hypothetical protein